MAAGSHPVLLLLCVLQYGEAEYWDHRYQAEPVFFDWYLSFQGLGEVLQRHVPVDAHILQVRQGPFCACCVPSGPTARSPAGAGSWQWQSSSTTTTTSTTSSSSTIISSRSTPAHICSRVLPLAVCWLQVGVGTSLLQAQMVEQAGYQNILSVDISSVAIKHMQQVHSHIPQLEYRVADCR